MSTEHGFPSLVSRSPSFSSTKLELIRDHTLVSIVNASLNSCLAQLAEIYGRKPVILVGFGFAFVGSLLVATAQDWRLLVVGSVLLGGCLANEGVFFAIPSEVLPRRYRGFGQCLFSLTGGIACTSAVLINGALM